MKGLAIASIGWLVVAILFIATGPWSIGTVVLDQVSIVAALFVLIALVAAAWPSVRDYYRHLLRSDCHLSKRFLWIAFAAACAITLRVVWLRYAAIEVNAWDFSVNFDRPIERTLHGTVLYSDEILGSMLGVHATWLSFLFVPLYAIKATPLWLLAAHALAIACGTAAAFVFFRTLTRDDAIAICLAAAFLLNRYTAKATQYPFHPEIFYPLGLFVLYAAFLRRNRTAFIAALLLLLSIKEDAVIPIAGFAAVAIIVYRQWRWAFGALAAAALVFAVDYFVVIPHYSSTKAGTPWYTTYWATYGATPIEALAGMARHPLQVLSRVASGASDMFASTAFVPLFGVQWLLAALPGLVIYGSSDLEKLHWFTLYYSMPVLPAIFASIPPGIDRLAGFLKSFDRRVVSRLLAVLVLIASIAIGSGHVLRPPHPDRPVIRKLLRQTAAIPRVWIQGAMFPHAGYDPRLQVLNERASVDGRAAFLLSAVLDPYPYDAQMIEAQIATLSADPRYRRIDDGSLVLFTPRQISSQPAL